MRRALIAALVLAPLAARAEVDWRAGVLRLRAVGAADLRAPSADIARVAAEREASARWQRSLRASLRALPLAGDGTVGQRADRERAVAETVDALVAESAPLKTLYSDGSVVLAGELSIDRLAARLAGAPQASECTSESSRPGSDAQPHDLPPPAEASQRCNHESPSAPVVIDARKLKLEPALGYRVRARGAERTVLARFAPPTDEAARAPVARATAAKDGVVTVDHDLGDATLVIFVISVIRETP